MTAYPLRPLLARAFALALALCAGRALAVDVRFDPVAPGVYAFIGETGARTRENEGLNANIGLVVTPAGALLIDSGASWQGARQIHDAVKRVTDQPVRWVINTGGQDHRWLGNGYFLAQGAELIGHEQGRADMQTRGGEQLRALAGVLGDRIDGTVPTLPTRWLRAPDETLRLPDTVVEIRHRGGAHTPGDLMVWLPQQRVLFSGDVVYMDRLLGVLPVSHTGRWMASLAELEGLAPAVVVPGHGRVTDLAGVRADTRDYLQALRTHMKQAVEAAADIGAAIRSFDMAPYARLRNAADLHPGNASRTYLELERE